MEWGVGWGLGCKMCKMCIYFVVYDGCVMCPGNLLMVVSALCAV